MPAWTRAAQDQASLHKIKPVEPPAVTGNRIIKPITTHWYQNPHGSEEFKAKVAWAVTKDETVSGKVDIGIMVMQLS